MFSKGYNPKINPRAAMNFSFYLLLITRIIEVEVSFTTGSFNICSL